MLILLVFGPRDDPLHTSAGVYVHVTTVEDDGGLITSVYVGSCREKLLSLSMSECCRFWKRVAIYSSLTQRWENEDEQTDSYWTDRTTCSEHGRFHWPEESDDDYAGELVDTAWFVAFAESRLEHCASLCGGDQQAGNLLYPLLLQQTPTMVDGETISKDWIHFQETYVTMYSGMSPTWEKKGGAIIPNPGEPVTVPKQTRSAANRVACSSTALQQLKANDPHQIWKNSSRDGSIAFHVTNQRLQLYETASPNKDRRQWTREKQALSEVPLTVDALRRYASELLHRSLLWQIPTLTTPRFTPRRDPQIVPPDANGCGFDRRPRLKLCVHHQGHSSESEKDPRGLRFRQRRCQWSDQVGVDQDALGRLRLGMVEEGDPALSLAQASSMSI